jgi:hypothetical protein
VVNSGTPSAAVFDFEIPQGATGATGPAGPAGPAGAAGTNAGFVLHSIRRSASVAITTVPNFHAYNTVLSTIDGAFWAYDGAGTWTCQADHKAEIVASASWSVTGVSARVIGDIVLGGVTSLQTQRNGAYSTTSLDGQTSVSRVRDWVAGETFRVYWYLAAAGGASTVATENVVTIRKG